MVSDILVVVDSFPCSRAVWVAAQLHNIANTADNIIAFNFLFIPLILFILFNHTIINGSFSRKPSLLRN